MPRKQTTGSKRWLFPVVMVTALAVGGCFLWQSTQPQAQPTPTSQSASAPQTTKSDRKHAYAGFPKSMKAADVTFLQNTGYCVGYSETHKDPLWAVYRAFGVDNPTAHPRPKGFKTDLQTMSKVAQKGDGFFANGFDHGHMAPNYVIDICYGEEAQRETFTMSNVCPQKSKLNENLWQRLEAKIAKDYNRQFGEVWVTVGPIFGENGDKLPTGVEVPKAFYCIMVREDKGKPKALAFIVPHTARGDEQLKPFLVNIREVEKQTGLDFNADLDQQADDELETPTAPDLW